MMKNVHDQSGYGTLKLTYLKNEWMEWTDIFHAGANSGELKVISMIFGWLWSELGMAI